MFGAVFKVARCSFFALYGSWYSFFKMLKYSRLTTFRQIYIKFCKSVQESRMYFLVTYYSILKSAVDIS